jgi:hypothetical protein
MKTVLSALVLFSILLLVAGAANATCDIERCYSVYKQCDNYFTEHVNADLCLYNGGYGYVNLVNSSQGSDYEGTDLDAVYFGNSHGFKFDGRPRDYMVYGTLNNKMPVAFFIQTSELFGDSQLINGVGYASSNGGVRCRLWGWRVDLSNCSDH